MTGSGICSRCGRPVSDHDSGGKLWRRVGPAGHWGSTRVLVCDRSKPDPRTVASAVTVRCVAPGCGQLATWPQIRCADCQRRLRQPGLLDPPQLDLPL